MTGLYDGVAGLLNDVFGAPVLHRHGLDPARTIRAVFRAPQVEVPGEDGHPVLDVAPHLRVRAADAAGIAIGDEVEPGDGRVWRVVNRQPSGSPAADAFIFFELEQVS